MEYTTIFSKIFDNIKEHKTEGEPASYIPELAIVNPNQYGVHLIEINGNEVGYGSSNIPFSVQSISKVLALTLAYKMEGENLWSRVGVEPSGTPFNSLVQLETDRGIPRNPFINAGAIVICDILISKLDDPLLEITNFVKSATGLQSITFNQDVYLSEKSTGFRNFALVNLMKAFGNINNDVDKVLDLYFQLSSLEMNCQELSRSFLYLANEGTDPLTKHTIIDSSKAKRIKAIMQLCGFYDEAGEFSFKVGLPGKSGVGGGIIAIHPSKFSIAVWSPRLNKKGNSHWGMKFLEQLTTETASSIF